MNLRIKVLSKVAILTLLTTTISATPAFAATGDIWNVTTDIGSVSSLLLHPDQFLSLLANLSNYSYEVNGKYYDIQQVNDLFKTNPLAPISDVQAKIATQLTGTLVVATKTITGTFSSLFEHNYWSGKLPDTTQTVTSVTVDGVTKTAGTDYSIKSGVVNILNVTATNVINIMTTDGITYTVTQGLTVISSVTPLNITTPAGTAPVLPSTVTATMSDGSTKSVAVTWGTVIPSSYAVAGKFTVTGTIANSTLTVTGTVTVGQTTQTIGVSHTALMPNYDTLRDVPQTMSFTNVVSDDEELYAAAYNQTGTIIAPALGNQFDGYTLTYDLTAPSGLHFNRLGIVALPVKSDGTGIARISATYNQVKGLVLNTLYNSNGTVYYSDGTNVSAVVAPAGFDPTAFASSAYDGSGQLHLYVNSDQSSAVIASGTAGSIKVNVNVYSNTSSTGVIDTTHSQGSASGTINASFTASNSISSLGLAGDLSGFYNYYPLLEGNAAPSSTLSVAGTASDDWSSSNASFVVAPFNGYPAMATVPTQGLTMNLTANKTGLFRYVDGYKLASKPSNVSVNVNSLGEVSVNNFKIWSARAGYKVVGYSTNTTTGATTILEQSTGTATTFMAANLADGTTTALTVGNANYLAGNFEGYLGFKTIGGQLQPLVAGYYTDNGVYAPASGIVSTIGNMVFAPVQAVQANVSDKYSESPTVTISNSLNSQTATATVDFTSQTVGFLALKSNPAIVNGVFGSVQTITLTVQDQYGNPLPNQTIHLPATSMNGLWITQVNGSTITSSVNMGSNSSTSMQTVSTPIPLFLYSAEGLVNKPAYDTISFAGITAYNLNAATRTVSLVTGVDGTVCITLQNGDVTYPSLLGTDTTVTRRYDVDGGRQINGSLNFTNDSAQNIGSVGINWAGRAAS